MDESTIWSFGLRYNIDAEHGPDCSNLANWFQYDIHVQLISVRSFCIPVVCIQWCNNDDLTPSELIHRTLSSLWFTCVLTATIGALNAPYQQSWSQRSQVAESTVNPVIAQQVAD